MFIIHNIFSTERHTAMKEMWRRERMLFAFSQIVAAGVCERGIVHTEKEFDQDS